MTDGWQEEVELCDVCGEPATQQDLFHNMLVCPNVMCAVVRKNEVEEILIGGA